MCLLFRYAVSLFPYFTWLMLILTVVTIGVQAAELFVSIQRINPTYIWLSDIIFILATLVELCLKVLYNIFNVSFLMLLTQFDRY